MNKIIETDYLISPSALKKARPTWVTIVTGYFARARAEL
jgi:hypothetical protein